MLALLLLAEQRTVRRKWILDIAWNHLHRLQESLSQQPGVEYTTSLC